MRFGPALHQCTLPLTCERVAVVQARLSRRLARIAQAPASAPARRVLPRLSHAHHRRRLYGAGKEAGLLSCWMESDVIDSIE